MSGICKCRCFHCWEKRIVGVGNESVRCLETLVCKKCNRRSPNDIMKTIKNSLLLSVCLMPVVAPLTSCEKKGPAEKMGESIDNAAEDVKDAVDPKGPVEKAGEKVDETLGN